jgi:hypothetical protein
LKEGVDIGPGFEIGFVDSFASNWQTVASWQVEYFGISDKMIRSKVFTGLSNKLDRNDTIQLTFTINTQKNIFFSPEISLVWQKYF